MKMTVRDLRNAISKYEDDTLVLVQGYEGGLCDIQSVRSSKVQLNVNTESWNGPHDETKDADTTALLILRQENPIAKD